MGTTLPSVLWIRSGAGRVKSLRLREVSELVSVSVRCTTYTVWGGISILISICIALSLAGMLRCNGGDCRPPGEATLVLGVMGIFPGLIGWDYVLCSWMKVTASGVEVANPVNGARIAWRDLTEAYVAPNGMSLRLRTEDWTVGVYPIQVSNWEGWFPSRVNRAQAWAKEINVLRDRFHEHEDPGHSAWLSPTKFWRMRVLPLVLAIAPWGIVALAFHPRLGNL